AGPGRRRRVHAQRDALPHGGEDRPGALPPAGGGGARPRRAAGGPVRAVGPHHPPGAGRRGARGRRPWPGRGGRRMNLSTTYLGFELPPPLVPGAGPLADNLDTVRRLEDAGAPMIVPPSLFEEQVVREEVNVIRSIETPKESYAEALSYFPEPEDFTLGPDDYLEQIRKVKAAVSVPVIGSLHGTTVVGWLRYAPLIEQAGADGLELNLYELALDPEETGAEVERRGLEVVRAVKELVRVPVAVKLSPFYSSIANYARRLDEAGADALVLFNPLYQPDLDVEQQELFRVNPSRPAGPLFRPPPVRAPSRPGPARPAA